MLILLKYTFENILKSNITEIVATVWQTTVISKCLKVKIYGEIQISKILEIQQSREKHSGFSVWYCSELFHLMSLRGKANLKP